MLNINKLTFVQLKEFKYIKYFKVLRSCLNLRNKLKKLVLLTKKWIEFHLTSKIFIFLKKVFIKLELMLNFSDNFFTFLTFLK